jgi:hypothetical protein
MYLISKIRKYAVAFQTYLNKHINFENSNTAIKILCYLQTIP